MCRASPTAIVGGPIDDNIAWMDVPRDGRYRWAYLDAHRVAVDAKTHDVAPVY